MVVGISTMILGEEEKELDRDDILFLKKSGLRYIELSNYHRLNNEIVDYLKQSDMVFYSIHAEYNDCDISGIDPAIRKRGVEDALRRVDIASRYGAGILVIHPGGWFDDNSSDKRTQNCIDSLVKISNYAGSRNIKIAIENLPMGFFGEDINTLDIIFKEVRKQADNAGNIGICLDTGHAHLTGNLYELLTNFKDYIITMHVQDNHGDNQKNRAKALDDLHLPPGHGQISWDDFFKYLEQIDYQGALIFELKGESIKGKDKNFIIDKLNEFVHLNSFVNKKI